MKGIFFAIMLILPAFAMADDDCATRRDVPDGVQSLQDVIKLGLCRNPQTAAAYASLRASHFNKNAGYKKMKYIKSKYILINLKEKKIQKELLLKKIKTIIQSLIIFAFINFIIYLLIKNALKLSKQYIKIKIYPDNNNTYAYYYYKNLSLNYTTQNYSIKDIEAHFTIT